MTVEFDKYIDENGDEHHTGKVVSKDGNVQNIPRSDAELRLLFNAQCERSASILQDMVYTLNVRIKEALGYRSCVTCGAGMINGEPVGKQLCYRCEGVEYDTREAKRLADAPVNNDWDGPVFIEDRMWSDAQSCAEDFECDGNDIPERAWCGKKETVFLSYDAVLETLCRTCEAAEDEDAQAYLDAYLASSDIPAALQGFNKSPPTTYVPSSTAIEVRKLFGEES